MALTKVDSQLLTGAITADSSNNVGIGTSSPSTRLQINGTSSQAPATLISSAQTGTTVRSNSVFRIQSEASGRDVYMQFSDNIANSTEIGMVSGNQYFCTSGTERMRIDSSGHVLPGANGTQNFGSSSLRWANLYTSDLHLSNGIGNYTIVEGEEDLFLYNNKNGKTYKFALIEVDPSTAPAKMKE